MIEFVQVWGGVFGMVASLVAILAFVLSLVNGRRKWITELIAPITQRLNDGSKKMDAHELEIQALKAKVDTLPDKQDVHDLQIGITEMRGELSTMAARSEGNSRIMERVLDFLERQEKGK